MSLPVPSCCSSRRTSHSRSHPASSVADSDRRTRKHNRHFLNIHVSEGAARGRPVNIFIGHDQSEISRLSTSASIFSGISEESEAEESQAEVMPDWQMEVRSPSPAFASSGLVPGSRGAGHDTAPQVLRVAKDPVEFHDEEPHSSAVPAKDAVPDTGASDPDCAVVEGSLADDELSTIPAPLLPHEPMKEVPITVPLRADVWWPMVSAGHKYNSEEETREASREADAASLRASNSIHADPVDASQNGDQTPGIIPSPVRKPALETLVVNANALVKPKADTFSMATLHPPHDPEDLGKIGPGCPYQYLSPEDQVNENVPKPPHSNACFTYPDVPASQEEIADARARNMAIFDPNNTREDAVFSMREPIAVGSRSHLVEAQADPKLISRERPRLEKLLAADYAVQKAACSEERKVRERYLNCVKREGKGPGPNTMRRNRDLAAIPGYTKHPGEMASRPDSRRTSARTVQTSIIFAGSQCEEELAEGFKVRIPSPLFPSPALNKEDLIPLPEAGKLPDDIAASPINADDLNRGLQNYGRSSIPPPTPSLTEAQVAEADTEKWVHDQLTHSPGHEMKLAGPQPVRSDVVPIGSKAPSSEGTMPAMEQNKTLAKASVVSSREEKGSSHLRASSVVKQERVDVRPAQPGLAEEYFHPASKSVRSSKISAGLSVPVAPVAESVVLGSPPEPREPRSYERHTSSSSTKTQTSKYVANQCPLRTTAKTGLAGGAHASSSRTLEEKASPLALSPAKKSHLPSIASLHNGSQHQKSTSRRSGRSPKSGPAIVVPEIVPQSNDAPGSTSSSLHAGLHPEGASSVKACNAVHEGLLPTTPSRDSPRPLRNSPGHALPIPRSAVQSAGSSGVQSIDGGPKDSELGGQSSGTSSMPQSHHSAAAELATLAGGSESFTSRVVEDEDAAPKAPEGEPIRSQASGSSAGSNVSGAKTPPALVSESLGSGGSSAGCSTVGVSHSAERSHRRTHHSGHRSSGSSAVHMENVNVTVNYKSPIHDNLYKEYE